MRWVMVCAAVLVAGCSPPAPTQPAVNATSKKPVPTRSPEPALAKIDLERLRAPGVGDIEAIRGRGYVRLLVVPSRTEYAIENGAQRGATFNAGKAFEAFLNSELATGEKRIAVVFIPAATDAIVADLNAGRGDVAANLLLTIEREDQVAFSEPVRKGVREVIATGPGERPIVSLEDVAGRSIHVRKSSDHHASLVRLNQQLARADKPVCTIVVADEALMYEDLVRLVNDGKIPATLVDDYVFRLMKSSVPKVAVNEAVAVSQDGILAWATRKDAPKLGALVNEFIESHNLDREAGR